MPSTQSQTSASVGQSQPLVLKEGQMIHGQIKQLFLGQMAEIQIGNQTMVAKLEVPLKAGDSYYFQVSSAKPELQLKIIAGPTTSADGQGLHKLMDAMQLPKSNEMMQLLNFVVKNKMPLSREGLLQAEALLKGVQPAARPEALIAIQKMVDLKLPLTEANFNSMISAQSKEGLQSVLASFRASLMTDSTVPADVKNLLAGSLGKIAKPFAETAGNALLANSLVNLLDKTGSAESRFATVQLLKSAGILPERTSLANLPQVLTSLMTASPSTDLSVDKAMPTLSAQSMQSGSSSVSGENRGLGIPTKIPVFSTQTMREMSIFFRQINGAPSTPTVSQLEGLKVLINGEPGLSTANKAALNAIVDQAATMRPTADASVKFVQQFSEVLIKMTAENTVASPFHLGGKGNTSKEPLLTLLNQTSNGADSSKLAALVQAAERSSNPEIQKLLQAAEGTVMTAIDGKAVKEAMQMVFRSLGLNYEAAMLGKNPDLAHLADSLKPQLLDLMQNPAISQTMRDGAEAIITRMNGPLLLSGENGVQHQLVMQVPLEFFGKRIDATLEWNGRMKEDGKIDPDFARILFYLELHSLEETVIDMQVQNKVVSVTVFNANEEVKMIGGPMIDSLKEGLDHSGYQLSGVFFKGFQEDQQVIPALKEETKMMQQGVDFRI